MSQIEAALTSRTLPMNINIFMLVCVPFFFALERPNVMLILAKANKTYIAK